jgi:hypothetical protein
MVIIRAFVAKYSFSEFFMILNYQTGFLFLHTFLLLTNTKKNTYLFTTNLIEQCNRNYKAKKLLQKGMV